MSSQSLSFQIGGNFGPLTNALSGWAGRIGGIVAGAFSAAAVAQFAGAVMSAGAQMETFEFRLGTLMGSSVAAKKRMQELYEYAAQTPFELDQIVGAETTLRGFGAAAEELLPGLIDFAAVTGTDLSQAAIDIGKAWQQGATGLESDWGRVLRKQVELREGVNATTMDLEDFRVALLGALREGATAEGAARLATTYSGMISTLTDEWNGFLRQVADAGVFDNVKAGLSEILRIIGENRDAIGELASATSTGLWWAIKGAVVLMGALGTAVRGVGIAAAGVNIAIAEIGSTTIEATQGVRDTVIAIAEATGQMDTAAYLSDVDDRLNKVAESMAKVKDNASEWLGKVLLAPTPLDDAWSLLARIEESAKNSSEYTRDMSENVVQAASPADGKAGKADNSYLDQLNAAAEFYDELRGLNQGYEEELRARRDEMSAEARGYLDAGIDDEQTYKENLLLIEEWYNGELSAYIDEMEAKRAEVHQAELDRIAAERRARVQMAEAQLSAVSGILDTIAGLYDENDEKTKAAHKRWATASIIVDTAAGIMRAFAQYGWPGGILPAAQIGITGAAEIAAVQKAHQGGILGSIYPDEADVTFAPGRRVRTLRGETIAVGNTQTARAMQDANRTNGATVGGGAQIIEFRVGRVAQREILRGDVARGDIIPRAVADAVSRGTRTTGWAARGAPL